MEERSPRSYHIIILFSTSRLSRLLFPCFKSDDLVVLPLYVSNVIYFAEPKWHVFVPVLVLPPSRSVSSTTENNTQEILLSSPYFPLSSSTLSSEDNQTATWTSLICKYMHSGGLARSLARSHNSNLEGQQSWGHRWNLIQNDIDWSLLFLFNFFFLPNI